MIEIACSISPRAVVSGDEEATSSEAEEGEGDVVEQIPPMLIGITFLNKHCYVPDLYAEKAS